MTKTHKVAAFLIAGILAAGAAQAKTAAPPKPAATAKVATAKPKVSMAQARKIALRIAPGKIKSGAYAKDGGRYSFDIQQKGHVQEVAIDGMTGKVVQNVSEGK
jgi:uncharacterized membrane protein YkoI